MKKLLFSLSLISATCFIAQAQQIPFYSQYYRNAYIYNPAFAGTGDDVQAFLMHRAQWRNIEGSPVTSALSIDGPVKSQKIGVGFTLYNDVSNILERTGLSTSYSYQLKMKDEHNLMFGLQLGILDNRVNFSQAVVNDANDPMLFNTSLRKTSLDAGFGVGYRWKDLEAGISIPQLPSTKVKFPGTDDTRSFYRMSRHYLGTVKYTFTVNEDKGMTAYPMVLARYIPGAPFQMDLNGVFDWEDRGWAALSYKMGYAVSVNVGVQIKEGLSVGYAYDYITSNIRNFSGASHEVMLSYRFGIRGNSGPASPSVDNEDLEILRKQTDENTEEIRRLREALEQQLNKASTDTVAPSDTIIEQPVDSGSFETGAVNGGKDFITHEQADFVDPNGNPAESGMYVILGAFKSLDNATKAMDEFKSRGYPNTSYIFNNKLGFYEVFASHPGGTEQAVDQLMEARKEYPDAWILILE